MTLSTKTLRPGLLVSVKTSVRGNIAYTRDVLEADHSDVDGKRVARWETQRTITDPVEFERAGKVRSKARSLIGSVCAHSAFGELCPEDDTAKLEAAVAEARRLVDEFNASASLTRVDFYVLSGRIAPDDVEAVRAINSEVRSLLEDMEAGLRKLDVGAVREAAGRARSVGQMLTADAQARIQVAIDAARASARQIVKAGEIAAQAIDESAIRRVREARTAFLDLDAAAEVAAPVVKGRAVDLRPEESASPTKKLKAAPSIEWA